MESNTNDIDSKNTKNEKTSDSTLSSTNYSVSSSDCSLSSCDTLESSLEDDDNFFCSDDEDDENSEDDENNEDDDNNANKNTEDNNINIQENISLNESNEQQNMTVQFGYGCKHYLRRCSIFAECCQEFFTCHRCHDDIKNDPSVVSMENHEIDRNKIVKIKCLNCDKEQNLHQYCENCNTCFGFYFCEICVTVDDIDKDYFHCEKCGICRIGRGVKFVHCDICKMCFNEKMTHVCIEMGDCPICCDDLKKSTVPVHKLKCGHSIHPECFSELIKTSYKCPMCQKSVGNMTNYIQEMDIHISQHPMPDEYKNDDGTNKIVKIYCNDCESNSETPFHFIGLKCSIETCGGYNTTQI